jgi:hypothetical protein
MLWCRDCWEKNDLARFEHLPDLFDEGADAKHIDPLLGEYHSVYENTHRILWCEKCIAELKTKAEKDNADMTRNRSRGPLLIQFCDRPSPGSRVRHNGYVTTWCEAVALTLCQNADDATC